MSDRRKLRAFPESSGRSRSRLADRTQENYLDHRLLVVLRHQTQQRAGDRPPHVSVGVGQRLAQLANQLGALLRRDLRPFASDHDGGRLAHLNVAVAQGDDRFRQRPHRLVAVDGLQGAEGLDADARIALDEVRLRLRRGDQIKGGVRLRVVERPRQDRRRRPGARAVFLQGDGRRQTDAHVLVAQKVRRPQHGGLGRGRPSSRCLSASV